MSDVSNAVLADVCSALEFVVLERLDGGFVRIGDYPLPPWFVRVFIQAQNEGVTLTSVFPVLDSFLSRPTSSGTSIGDGRLSSEAVHGHRFARRGAGDRRHRRRGQGPPLSPDAARRVLS